MTLPPLRRRKSSERSEGGRPLQLRTAGRKARCNSRRLDVAVRLCVNLFIGQGRVRILNVPASMEVPRKRSASTDVEVCTTRTECVTPALQQLMFGVPDLLSNVAAANGPSGRVPRTSVFVASALTCAASIPELPIGPFTKVDCLDPRARMPLFPAENVDSLGRATYPELRTGKSFFVGICGRNAACRGAKCCFGIARCAGVV